MSPGLRPGVGNVLDPITAKMELAIMKSINKIIASMVWIQKFTEELFRSYMDIRKHWKQHPTSEQVQN